MMKFFNSDSMIHKAAMYGNLDEFEQLIVEKGQDPCKFAEVGVLLHCSDKLS